MAESHVLSPEVVPEVLIFQLSRGDAKVSENNKPLRMINKANKRIILSAIFLPVNRTTNFPITSHSLIEFHLFKNMLTPPFFIGN